MAAALRLLPLSRRLTTRTTTIYLSLLRPLSAASRHSPPSLKPSFPPRRLFSADPGSYWADIPAPVIDIYLPGCDLQHWLVVTHDPPHHWTRDQIIDSYIKTLATVVGSEDEARMKIYSVSTKYYFAFGALISEELARKLSVVEKVRAVEPDSYLDVQNKDYGGEPFINGQAVPYDSKYHARWVNEAETQSSDNTQEGNMDGPPGQPGL